MLASARQQVVTAQFFLQTSGRIHRAAVLQFHSKYLSFGGPMQASAQMCIRDRGIHLRDRLAAAPRILRWAVYEGALFLFLFMGYFLGGGGFLYAIY